MSSYSSAGSTDGVVMDFVGENAPQPPEDWNQLGISCQSEDLNPIPPTVIGRITTTTTYGTGSASGFFGEDTVRFGPPGTDQLVVPGTVIGQAVRVAPFFARAMCDGILGLGFRDLSASNVNPPLLNAIDQKLIDPILTVYLEYGRNVDHGGVFTYGGLDNANCGDVIAYEPLTQAVYWQFRLKAVSSGYVVLKKGWEVISDTGTSLLGIPKAIADLIADGAGAVYDFRYGMYHIDCQATPLLNLTIGHHVYTIEAVNLVTKMNSDFCTMNMFPMSGLSFGPEWILGDPFIRQYCNIHNYNTKEIGFAKSLQK
ncbi:unnamed protein product [Heligmosomoides polygyrus]|uniref:Peptidase A1 domain-containing protein n=1 Tax=Heligmosomoides polygyrus TaxID=6339 RepID=A0A3P8DWX8_HELPZ|nr:unnamed protein product [Heligmosomoides polygyrus]